MAKDLKAGAELTLLSKTSVISKDENMRKLGVAKEK